MLISIMAAARTDKRPKARTIALFPGAFRPPHAAHFAAVGALLSRPDIDEVVVIVTNRCRNVPGTTKALDTGVAEKIWSIFLRHVENKPVRVEMAVGSAVEHAFGYFDRVAPGDELLFCLGESDYGEGDSRFATVRDLAARSGVRASVIAAPTGDFVVRATALRASLAQGEAGRAAFLAAMPAPLNPEERETVWRACREGMQEASETAGKKVRDIMARGGFDNLNRVEVVKGGKTDEVFRLALADGRNLFVKYANDTVKAASFANPNSLKPRKRLSVERRAINWLRSSYPDKVELPTIEYFDKRTKLLALGEVCPGGGALADDLARGIFDPAVAEQAVRFLAQNCSLHGQVPAFWGNVAADREHWRIVLALRAGGTGLSGLSDRVREQLAQLRANSDAESVNCYLHLDFCPKNILLSNGNLGIIDLEMSSSIGDPACELGYLIGHYLLYAKVSDSSGRCLDVVGRALRGYREAVNAARPGLWGSMRGRTLAFAGAALLHSADDEVAQERQAKIVAAALDLLSVGLEESADVETALAAVLSSSP